jgi:hypothetical protein
MKKYLIIILCAFTVTACKKEKETELITTKSDSLKLPKDSVAVTSSGEKIVVETIPFPKEIKECSCYFAKSKVDFINEKYIYADDAGKTAYMKIDGKRLTLNLLSSSDMEENDELSKEIETENYKISVKGRKIKSEEALLFEGTITIEKPDGSVIKLPVYGECAC